jgi:hypothetical protein
MEDWVNSIKKVVDSLNYIIHNTRHIGFNTTQNRTNIIGNVNIGGHMIDDYALKSEVPDIENLNTMIENLSVQINEMQEEIEAKFERFEQGSQGEQGLQGQQGPRGEDGDSDTWYNWLFNVGNTLANVAEGVGIYAIETQVAGLTGAVAGLTTGLAALTAQVQTIEARFAADTTLENVSSLEDLIELDPPADLPDAPEVNLEDTGTTGSSSPSTSIFDSLVNSLKNVCKDIAERFSSGTTTFQGLNNTPLLEVSSVEGEFSDFGLLIFEFIKWRIG